MGTTVPLTGAALPRLPAPCVDCVFWQTGRGITDGARKDRWVRGADREGTPFGRVLTDAEGGAAMVQYGAASLFPRARRLPAGPASADAALITCVFLPPADPWGTCERLLLEALADLKARGHRAVEAFALRHPPEVPRRERIAGHHTLLDRDGLGALGFAPLRHSGQVSLMRLELGGLLPLDAPAETVGARLRRLLVAGRPAPA